MTKILTKLVIFLAINLLGLSASSAQGLPVYDNTNFLSLAKQLLESAKQTSELLNTVELLKEQKENLELVSSAINQLQAVREIQSNNKKLFDLVQSDLRGILSSPYIRPDEITQVSESFNTIVETSLAELEFTFQILSSDFLKMSDGERSAILEQKQLQSRERVSDVRLKTRRYNDIISFRKMQDMVNNRDSPY